LFRGSFEDPAFEQSLTILGPVSISGFRQAGTKNLEIDALALVTCINTNVPESGSHDDTFLAFRIARKPPAPDASLR
jgi:hypothetical protein